MRWRASRSRWEGNREQLRTSQWLAGNGCSSRVMLVPLAIGDIHEIAAGDRPDRRLVRDTDILIEYVDASEPSSVGIEDESNDAGGGHAVLHGDDRAAVPNDSVAAE